MNTFNKFPAIYIYSICVWNMIKQSESLQTRYGTTCIYDRHYIRTHVYVFLFCVKNACLNYREFDLEGDLVGVPHTWYLSAQSFITLLKLVWREFDIVAMNEWKKKCVGLQRTWVSKRTVRLVPRVIGSRKYPIKWNLLKVQCSWTFERIFEKYQSVTKE